MVRLIVFLALFLCSFGLMAQYDSQAIHPDLDGDELLEQVVQDYKPATVLTYGQARDTMYAKIYNVNDTIYGVYTRHDVYLPPGADPTNAIFMNGSNNGINTEHTYPRSKGAENGNPRSDMHHLFGTRVIVNSARGNLPFGEVPDAQTNLWFFSDQSQNNIPGANIDAFSELGNSLFEPREDHKGNVARAMFYFYTMYKEQADGADPNYFAPQINTLCDWHNMDPVDSLEWVRTLQIAEYQEGKPNPFVIDCSLAGRSYCPEVTSACRSVNNEELQFDSELKVYPNPAIDLVNIQLNDNASSIVSINILNAVGQSVLYKENIDPLQKYFAIETFKLNQSSQSQFYFVQILIEKGNQVFIVNRKIKILI